MNSETIPYVVGFKDVYPWVWSVMLGVSLTLAERRGAFSNVGTRTLAQFCIKNIAAIVVNVGVPAVVFGITMTRLGPVYSSNMGFWQILGCLYLAGVPLGAHHAWLGVATRFRWMPARRLQYQERQTQRLAPLGNLIWAILVFGLPTLAAIFGWRLPF
jgi:hypothetical protein